MTANRALAYSVADDDPFAPRVLATTAHPRWHMIMVLRSDRRSDRYVLHRFPDGSVWWRADTFTAPEYYGDPERWIGYGGELSVAEVVERVPDQHRAVLEWTRAELASGLEVAGIDDLDARDRRARSLERLRGELDEVRR
jgi:hypothetical protein